MSNSVCMLHTDRPATALCTECGRPLCPECTQVVADKPVCQTCLSAIRSRVATQLNAKSAALTYVRTVSRAALPARRLPSGGADACRTAIRRSRRRAVRGIPTARRPVPSILLRRRLTGRRRTRPIRRNSRRRGVTILSLFTARSRAMERPDNCPPEEDRPATVSRSPCPAVSPPTIPTAWRSSPIPRNSSPAIPPTRRRRTARPTGVSGPQSLCRAAAPPAFPAAHRHRRQLSGRRPPRFLAAAVVGGGIYIAVVAASHFSIGYMALGVGFLVGWAVKLGVRVPSKGAGIMAVVLAVLGILPCEILTYDNPSSLLFTALFLFIGCRWAYGIAAGGR